TIDVASISRLCAEAMERPCSAEVKFWHSEGSTGFGELLVSHVTGADEPLFVVVLHDLTERHRAQQRLEDQAVELEHQASMLQEQAVELEQSNEELLQRRTELEVALTARNRFYASMSHELRTPI